MLKDALFFGGGVVLSVVLFRYFPTLQATIAADLDKLKAKVVALKAKV